MFCPRCGDALGPSGTTAKCVRGAMELSADLHRRLTEVFVARTRSGASHPGSWGGTWYCPGCGTRAENDREHVRCGHCGELLDEFLSALVELHPHR